MRTCTDAKTKQSYTQGGGFSVDASVRIGQHDRAGLERLLLYFARPPFAGERIRIQGEQIIYRCLISKLGTGGRAGRHKHSWQART
jgi:Putative transposase